MVTGTVNPGVLGSALGDLVLRIQGSSRNGQVLRLKSAKCTIGSGPGCTLRLHGLGVEPLHCLILRGPNGTVIRRWSPDTRLNGRTFSNMHLSAGDRLSIGSLEFEIVATGEIAAEPPAAIGSYTGQDQHQPSWTKSRKDIDLESEQLDARERQLRLAEESLDQRAKQLEETAATLQAEQDQFAAERRHWEDLRNASLAAESQQRAAAEEEQLIRIKTRWADLESERQIWNLQQQRWQAEQEASRRQLQDRERQLNEREAEIEALTSELESRRSEINAQNAALELQKKELNDKAAELADQIAKNHACADELDARSVQLDNRAADLQSQTEELDVRRVHFDSQAADLEKKADELKIQSAELQAKSTDLQTQMEELDASRARLDSQAADLEKQAEELKIQSDALQGEAADLQARAAELDARQSEFETERSRWRESCQTREEALASREEEIIQKAAQLETPQAQLHAERKSEKTPAEVEDVLRRLGREIERPEETDNFTAEASLSPPSAKQDNAEETLAPPSSQKSSVHGHEEESVDDYMVRLMERIRSTQGELSNTGNKPYTPASSRPDSASLLMEPTPPPQKPTALTWPKLRENVELSTHTVAPEKHVDLTALRDLANYSAQSALGKHARRQMIHIMYSKLSVALLGGFAGMGLLWTWQRWFPSALTLFSAMMSFAVAVIWGVQYVLLTIQLLINGSDNPNQLLVSHHKDNGLKTPSNSHTISGTAGEEHAKDLQSAAEAIKPTQPAGESEDSEKHRYFKNVEQP